MFTYLALNLVFLVAAAVLVVRKQSSLRSRPHWIALGILCGLTLVFDNLIILAEIVAYDRDLISGILLGWAPIEDFFYPLVGVILLPYVWEKLRKKS